MSRPLDRRFDEYALVMVIDEFGNPGIHPSYGERYFGYGVSVTNCPEAFAAVTADNRFHHQGEWKARDDSVSRRMKITMRIAATDTRTYGYHIDKCRPPKEWYGDNRARIMTDVMSYVVRSTLSQADGNVLVVVDDHRAYRGRARQIVERYSTPWRIVKGGGFDSSDSEYADLLQSQDYVANAIRSHLETEISDTTRTEILRTHIHRVGNDEIYE